jgi:hypothetical protein
MGNICVKKKLKIPETKLVSKTTLFIPHNNKRKIHPINNLNNLKNNFYNIEDNFPDKNDLDNFRKLYYGGWTITSFPTLKDQSIQVRPSTANIRNKFNLNQ